MFKIKFDDKKLLSRIAAIEADADKIANEVASNLGAIVQSNARRYVPVDTGSLKKSITMEVKDDTASIGTPLDYAPHIEYGTVKQAPKPFLSPALEDARRVADKIAQEVVKKYVK